MIRYVYGKNYRVTDKATSFVQEDSDPSEGSYVGTGSGSQRQCSVSGEEGRGKAATFLYCAYK